MHNGILLSCRSSLSRQHPAAGGLCSLALVRQRTQLKKSQPAGDATCCLKAHPGLRHRFRDGAATRQGMHEDGDGLLMPLQSTRGRRLCGLFSVNDVMYVNQLLSGAVAPSQLQKQALSQVEEKNVKLNANETLQPPPQTKLNHSVPPELHVTHGRPNGRTKRVNKKIPGVEGSECAGDLRGEQAFAIKCFTASTTPRATRLQPPRRIVIRHSTVQYQ